MLKHYTLDPTFINYGNYHGEIELLTYSPRSREVYAHKKREGYHIFFGNFLDASWAFTFETNDTYMIKELIKSIEENKQTRTFKSAFLDKFNAIRFETIFYLKDSEIAKYRSYNNEWWITLKEEPVLHISEEAKIPDTIQSIEESIKRRKLALKGHHKVTPVYFERHYLDDEWDEVLDLFRLHGCKAIQFCRKLYIAPDDDRTYVEHTFKSTGRKILCHFTAFHMIYKELDN